MVPACTQHLGVNLVHGPLNFTKWERRKLHELSSCFMAFWFHFVHIVGGTAKLFIFYFIYLLTGGQFRGKGRIFYGRAILSFEQLDPIEMKAEK